MTDSEVLQAILARYPDILNALQWRPMESAPIDGTWVIACTTHGNIQPVQYRAYGDFKDRWGYGNCTVMCLGWLPITAVASPLDHRIRNENPS